MIDRKQVREVEIAAWRNNAPWHEHETTFVFIPGSGGDHTLWLYVLDRLRGDFNLLAVNLPGHGESQGAGEADVGRYVDWVKDILAVYEVTTPIIVGHSLGAAIVLTFAVTYPHLIAGVVAIGGGARMPVNPMIFEAIKKDLAGLMAMTAKIGVAKKNRERLAPLLTARSPHPDTLYGDFLACDRLAIEEELSKIRIPTLIVCGEEDKMTPPNLSRELAARIPGAQLVLIPETGHMVMLEEPERLAEELRAFSRRIEAQGA